MMPGSELRQRKETSSRGLHDSGAAESFPSGRSAPERAALDGHHDAAPAAQRSWRFYARWIARVMLPVFVLLSSVEVVRIPDVYSAGNRQPVQDVTVLLVIAYARPAYLRRTLNSVRMNYATRGSSWRMVISLDRQDGRPHQDVAEIASSFAQESTDLDVEVWFHETPYQAPDAKLGKSAVYDEDAYRRISAHYFWALRRVFAAEKVHRVVVLEDDLEIAPDFFSYFEVMSPLLDADPTLFCISAWNDNGKEHLSKDPAQLHRTDFFPGLGWMISRHFWKELETKWPDTYWDDWLRSQNQTKGRQCIRPEVSRTANFGAEGVSQSFMHEAHISKVVLNTHAVDFSKANLSNLSPDAYEKLFFERLSRAVLLEFSNYLTSKPQNADVIARYRGSNVDAIGKRTGIMTDNRDGVLRTSYRGVVVIPWNGHWAFFVEREWTPPRGYTLGSSVCCR